MIKSQRLLPFLYASSWTGLLLLTALAAFLVFRQHDPLTPAVFIAAALCLLSGNLLPLAVYFLHLRSDKNAKEAESFEAELSVRHALARSEDVLNRLDEAEGALSKALLGARQLPKRLEESSSGWEDVLGRLRELESDSLLHGLSEQTAAVRDLATAVEKAQQPPQEDIGERADLLFEAMENLQAGVDAVAAQLTVIEKRIPSEANKKKRNAGKPSQPERETEEKDPSSQNELFPPSSAEARDAAPDGEEVPKETRIHIHAMVGINNRLFLRGDGPELSWETGELLQPVGIGEYRKTFSRLEEPLRIALLLNDEHWSAEGRFTIEPGTQPELHVSFPQE